VIEEDASTDNSPMLIKYLMDSTPSKVKFTQSKEKKGALKGLKEAIEQCSEDSIVVLLEDNEAMLGDIAFNIIDRIASNVDADLLSFGTLTTPYLNI
jgi:glycosyltransferase involved in cell wall biosynthesis